MGVTFPNESPEYRAARDKLLQREVSLRREMEAVARRSEHFRQVGRFPRTTSSIILMQRGRQRRCGCPNCSGRAPIR